MRERILQVKSVGRVVGRVSGSAAVGSVLRRELAGRRALRTMGGHFVAAPWRRAALPSGSRSAHGLPGPSSARPGRPSRPQPAGLPRLSPRPAHPSPLAAGVRREALARAPPGSLKQRPLS